MEDTKKTKAQLVAELEELRKRNAELEKSKSELSRTQDKLLESENKFRQLFENEPEYCYMISPEGEIININNSALKALGYQKDEIIGMPFLTTIYASSSQEKAKRLFKEWEKTGKLRDEELNIVTKDREERTVLLSADAIRNESGKIIHSISIQRDITECKLVEEKLKKFQIIIESAQDAIFFKDLKSRYIYANDKTTEVFGLPREKIIGKNDYELMLDKGEARKNIEDDQLVITTSKIREITKHMTGADGREYWFQAIKVPQFDDKRKIVGLAGIARDITNIKKAEVTLKESEAKYKILIESSPVGIQIADIETKKFKYSNPAICKMLGYSKENLQKMYVSDIHPQDTLEHVISEFEAQSRGEKTLAPNIPCLRKDGEVIYADINTVKVFIDGRECNVGFFSDITKRKKAEEELYKAKIAIESSLNAIFISDIEGSVTYANQTAQKMWGYDDPKEMIGTECFRLLD